MKKDCIIYYGAFLTDRVASQRSLPILNNAATKRILRVAQGLDGTDRRCFVLSSGLVPKIKSTWRVLPALFDRVEGIPLIVLSQLGVRYLGYFVTPITAILAAIRIRKKRKFGTIIQYNYYPDAFIFALWCKVVYRSKVVLDLEDVSVPRWSDWKKGSEARPFGEIWCWLLMKLSIWNADLVFSPSRKLSCVVRDKRKFMAVTGCQRIDKNVSDAKHDSGGLHILMSGGIKFENGIEILADAVRLADKKQLKSKLDITVCGSGKYEWLRERIGQLSQIKVCYRGFLSFSEFDALYKTVDICLALQQPNGRYGQFKAPSKGYEALCSGKALIVSDVGDFDDLPEDVCYKLKPYTAVRLAEIMSGLTLKEVSSKKINALVYSRDNFESSIVGQRILTKLKELTQKR